MSVPVPAEVYRLCSAAGCLELAEPMIDAALDLWSVRLNLDTVTTLRGEFPELAEFIVHHYRRLLVRDLSEKGATPCPA